MDKNIKRCNICILPSTYHNISFNKKGICNFCAEFTPDKKEQVLQNEEHVFKELLGKFKSTKAQYDCLVPISGGKDSAFLLYLVKKVYNLRPLAFHFDNGFVTRQAKNNVLNITEKLQVPLETCRPGDKVLERAYLPTKKFCYMCNSGMQTMAYRTATDKKIPLILWGLSKFDKYEYLGIFKKPIFNINKLLTGTVSIFSKDFLVFLINMFIIRNQLKRSLNQQEFDIFFLDKKIMKSKHSPVILFPLLYHNFEFNDVMKILKDELGWKKGSSVVSSFHADCLIHSCLDSFYITNKSFDEQAVRCSYLIRLGKMTREEALRLINDYEHININELLTESRDNELLVKMLKKKNRKDFLEVLSLK